MKYILSLILVFWFFSMAPSYGLSAEKEAEKYQKCMSLAQDKPEKALVYVKDWIFSQANGVASNVPAGHCKASIYLALGQTEEAAKLFEKLVDDMVVGGISASVSSFNAVSLKAQIYLQAALAWKEAGNFDKAYEDLGAALSSMPPLEKPTELSSRNDADKVQGGNRTMLYELYLERGTLQILRGEYHAAIEDLTLALDQDDGQAEAFLQRAKAYRKKKAYLEARLDLKVATKLVKEQPDSSLESGILLEQGILFEEQGEKMKAKKAWQDIVDLYPDSDYAILAKKNINLLNVD